ncbi:hypothetical protein A0126_18935 (plasmid) [Exiguobacterium sp. N4-1P]|uniref:ABC transporter ATP-binding protein n=1 Tax=Exiguobacterium sp. N4-1P TaxID=2051906 RepID=UPI000B594AAB|nr:ABC transporter ATP-binding protein [Exiguobacterium sp. N4-1P]ASI36890.1 hypothetical protein A0126_15255 [Exiguobacterium sp. N4-1P]ASI37663.1 hypothetical protein A0126_18935 [Exiguobacterium sp. N4-1P]
MFFLLFRYFDKNIIKLIFGNILLGIFPVAGVYLFTKIVEIVTEHQSLDSFILYSFLLILSIVSGPVINDYMKIVLLHLNKNIKKNFVETLNTYYSQQDFLYLQSPKFQNKVSIIEGFDQEISGLYQTFFSIIRNLITLSGTLLLVLSLNIFIVLSVLIASILSIAVNRYIGKLQFEQTIELLNDTRMNDKLLSEMKFSKNQPQIYLNNSFKKLFKIWVVHYEKITSIKAQQLKKLSHFNISTEMIMTSSFIFICFFIWKSATFSAAKIVLILQSMNNFQSSISQLGDNYVELREFKNRTRYIEEFITHLKLESTDISSKKESLPEDTILEENIHTFSLQRLNYAFPNKEILKVEEPLTIKSGEIFTLQGANGEGKSTLLNCLTGIYDSNIQVSLNNNYLLDKETLKSFMQKKASVLHQWNIKMVGDFLHNLLSSHDSVLHSDFKLVNSFYQQFESDFSKILDLEFEDGIDLSGGQWQLLFLTRTLLKECDVYIFDEPSNHLDDQKIKMLIQDLNLLKQRGKIVFLISHDPRLKEITPHCYELRNKRIKLLTKSEVSVF